jgi:hypothetical protein
MIKSKRMKWAGHVARLEKMKMRREIDEKLKAKPRLEEIAMVERIIFKCTLKRWEDLD